MLRNVNLCLCSGTQASLVRAATQGHQWRIELGGKCFLAMKNGEDSAAGRLQCTHLAESSAETSAEGSSEKESKEVSSL